MPDAAPSQDPRAPVWPAVVIAALISIVGAAFVSSEKSYGWDESMHAALPAARIALALRAAELGEAIDVALDCHQYPFAYPAALGLVETVFGVSEGVARAFGRVIWGLGLLGLFLAVREAVAASRWLSPERARLAPYLALALGALSPLALAFSGTLFQEIPFTALAAWSVWAWLRRDGSARRELAAGALITLAFFTRFNTGLLLGFGLFLDLAVAGVLAGGSGELRDFFARAAWLAAIPVLAFAWWFLLPLPGGTALGAEHREAFFAFLGGNRGDSFRIPWSTRWVHWMVAFAPSPRAFVLMAAALIATVVAARRPGVRALWFLFLGAGIPVWMHEFHLDRFLIHQGVAIWGLAAIGIARFAPGPRPAVTAAVALLLCVVFPRLDARPVGLALVDPPEDAREYVVGALADMGSLAPGRTIETNGLARAEADQVMDLVADAIAAAKVDGEARVAWLGINSELSPAAIHLALLDRGGSPVVFRRDAARARADGHPDMCVSFEGIDPGWDAARLVAWAEAFDLVITTRPVDFKGRAARAWVSGYQDMLLMSPGWGVEKLGVVSIARPNRAPVEVEVFACRKS